MSHAKKTGLRNDEKTTERVIIRLMHHTFCDFHLFVVTDFKETNHVFFRLPSNQFLFY